MWNAIGSLVEELKRCQKAEATIATVAMAYICIDTMAYLSMPDNKTSQSRKDFITWVDTYLKGDSDQPYQYDGKDVYAARCGLLHAFSAEANMHKDNPNIRKFVYNDGGLHAFNPNVSPNLVIIGTASFINDVIISIGNFMIACQQDDTLRQRVEARLPTLYQVMPVP